MSNPETPGSFQSLVNRIKSADPLTLKVSGACLALILVGIFTKFTFLVSLGLTALASVTLIPFVITRNKENSSSKPIDKPEVPAEEPDIVTPVTPITPPTILTKPVSLTHEVEEILENWLAKERLYIDDLKHVLPEYSKEIESYIVPTSTSSSTSSSATTPTSTPRNSGSSFAKTKESPRGRSNSNLIAAQDDTIQDALVAMKELVAQTAQLLKRHTSFEFEISNIVENKFCSSTVGKVIEQFVRGVGVSYASYWKEYSVLRAKIDMAIFTTDFTPGDKHRVQTYIDKFDERVNEKLGRNENPVAFLKLISAAAHQVQFYETVLDKLLNKLREQEAQQKPEDIQYVDIARSQLVDLQTENSLLLDNIFQQEKLFELKKKLKLGNLGAESFEFGETGSIAIPRAPRFIYEGKLMKVSYESQPGVATEYGKEKVKKTSQLLDAYLFDNVLILAKFLGKEAPKTKIIHLSGAYFDKLQDTASYKNAFAIQTATVEHYNIFAAESAESRDIWLGHLAQVLDKKPRLDRKESKKMLMSLDTFSDSEAQNMYGVPLEELYQNRHLWEPFEAPDTPENIEYIEGTNSIRCATLDKLIQKLTHHMDVDKNNQFMFAFLLTYRSFITPEELLEKLKNRFNTPPSNKNFTKEEFKTFKSRFLFPVRLKVCQVIEHWIEKHSYDFRPPPQTVDSEQAKLVSAMLDFIEKSVAKSGFMQQAATQLKELVMKQSKRRDTFYAQKQNYLHKQLKALNVSFLNLLGGQGGGDTPKPRIPRSLRSVVGKGLYGSKIEDQQKAFNVAVVEWPSIEIARQLTLIELSIFERIQPKECLNQNWNKKNRQEKAPNIFEMIDRTNLVVNWVAMEILRYSNLKERVHALKKFIKTARECRAINNFNAVYEIVGGLNSIAIHRLKKTWEQVPPKLIEEFKRLETLTSQLRNFKTMREAIKGTLPPCIPYVGLYLTDLTFIEDGNPDVMNGKINFFKRQKLSVIIREIQMFQKTPYKFHPVPELQNKLKNMNVMNEDSLVELSTKLEPINPGKK